MNPVQRIEPRQIEIVCHKGANEYAPENTFAAAQLCIDWGMDYVEIDVNRSRDGVHYILHGPNLEATTNGVGRFDEMLSADIDRLDAGSWFDARFAGERVPRLEPFLRWIQGKAKIFLDIKSADIGYLIGLVYEMGLQEECFFWFGDPDNARRFRELDSQLALKVNVRTVEELLAAHAGLAANIVEVRLPDMSPELANACRTRAIEIMIYHPEKEPDAFRQILEWGVEKVNLNHGDLFAAVEADFVREGR